MIKNFICESCNKLPVCKISDVLFKFDEDAKKPLGVNITIDSCSHYLEDGDDPD